MEIITFNPKAVNSVSFIGNPTKEIELKYTPKGTAVAEFSLAVNRSYKQNDEWKKDTLFIGVVLYGDLAKECADKLTTKTQVQVSGYLRQQRWEKNGEKRSKLDVVGFSVYKVASSVNNRFVEEPVKEAELATSDEAPL